MKQRRKKRRGRPCDSESGEDAPLAPGTPNGVSDPLREWSVEKCEFCDEVFRNKYSMLVHNAKHIIIPLLKQKYHQCTECLHHFTSIECLEWHTINKHPSVKNSVPELLKSFVNKEPTIVVKTPIEINEAISKKESLLQSFVKQQPITVLTKENFSDNNEIVRNINVDDRFSDNVDVVISDDDDIDVDAKSDVKHVNGFDNDDSKSDSSKFNCKRIKDRLTFEDDGVLDETDSLINDLTTDCKVNLEMFDDKWINSLRRDPVGNRGCESNLPELFDITHKNSIVLGNKPIEVTYVSVPYEELVRPIVHQCSKCQKTFPNRYLGIIHETSHLKFKKRKMPLLCRHCDWYISAGPMVLHRHVARKHGGAAPPRDAPAACAECGLAYVRLRRHRHNYHWDFGCDYNGCEQIFSSAAERARHERDTHGLGAVGTVMGSVGTAPGAAEWRLRVVRVCDLCYSFFRNKINLNYEHLGEMNEVGERHSCERCQKNFFSLNIVRLRSKKHVKHIRHNIEMVGPLKKKVCSNAERLKNVQMRLKKLKSLNKF